MGTYVVSHLQHCSTSRSLTDIFIMLRNNAMDKRHVFDVEEPTAVAEDRLTLIPLGSGSDGDVALSSGADQLIPEWVGFVDEVQYEVSKIRARITELKELQQKHLTRPSFSDESGLEEKNIEVQTHEITRMMAHVQNMLQEIQRARVSGGTAEKFRRNIIAAHVDLLQKLNMDFRQSQSRYLQQVKSYEDACEKYFGSFTAEGPSLPDYQLQDGAVPPPQQHEAPLSMSSIQMQEENAAMAREREKEIACISESILELNHLFKDLATLVVDQGTVLDRIDYNIERSCLAAKAGSRSIRKVAEYQRKSRKMTIIVFLSCVIIVLLVVLIAVKT